MLKHNKAAHHPRGQRAASTFQILLNYDCCKDTIKKRDYKTASPFSVVFILNIGFDGFNGFSFAPSVDFLFLTTENTNFHKKINLNIFCVILCLLLFLYLTSDFTDSTDFSFSFSFSFSLIIRYRHTRLRR